MDQCLGRIAYCLIPVVLQIKHLLPDGERDERGVAAEYVEMVSDFDLVSHHVLSLVQVVSLVVVLLSHVAVKHRPLLGKALVELTDPFNIPVLACFACLLDACEATEAPKDVQASSLVLALIALKEFIQQWE